MDRQVDNDIIEEIRSKGLESIKNMYISWRDEFEAFTKQYTSDTDLSKDIFQDALIICYENIVDGKLTYLSSSLKTYVFSIGKFQLLNRLKKQKEKYYDADEIDRLSDQVERFEVDKNEIQNMFILALKKLGKNCQDIIVKFYYEKKSIHSIMKETNLKNENTVKAHKSRCMKKLKTILKK